MERVSMNLQKILSIAFVLCYALSIQHLSAQTKDSTVKKILYLGPEFGITLGMNTADYHVENVKRSVGIGLSIGAVFAYKFENENALLAGLHFYSLSFSDENEYAAVDFQKKNIDKLLTTKGTYSYIAISAMLRASVVLFGFQIGIPIDGKASNSFGASTGRLKDAGYNIQTGDVSIATSDIKVQFEPRIGVEFPIVKQDKGEFLFGFTFGYPVQIMSSSPFKVPKLVDNFRIPNVKIQASYRFSLGKNTLK